MAVQETTGMQMEESGMEGRDRVVHLHIHCLPTGALPAGQRRKWSLGLEVHLA